MAYTTQANIERYVPNAPDTADFTGFIADADKLIDANFRSRYEVPFSPVPEYIERISTMLASAYLRRAYFGQTRKEPDALADRYERDALRMIADLIKTPSLIDAEPRDTTSDDEDASMVIVLDEDKEGVFSMGDETEWGD